MSHGPASYPYPMRDALEAASLGYRGGMRPLSVATSASNRANSERKSAYDNGYRDGYGATRRHPNRQSADSVYLRGYWDGREARDTDRVLRATREAGKRAGSNPASTTMTASVGEPSLVSGSTCQDSRAHTTGAVDSRPYATSKRNHKQSSTDAGYGRTVAQSDKRGESRSAGGTMGSRGAAATSLAHDAAPSLATESVPVASASDCAGRSVAATGGAAR